MNDDDNEKIVTQIQLICHNGIKILKIAEEQVIVMRNMLLVCKIYHWKNSYSSICEFRLTHAKD